MSPPADWLELLPQQAVWNDRPAAADLAGLPNHPAVFLLTDAESHPIQALTAQQLRRAVLLRLTPAEVRGKRADLGEIVRRVYWRDVHSRFEARWAYLLLMRRLAPRDYRERVGFGPAWFLSLDRSRLLPELRVSERAWLNGENFVGPWATQRSAQAALESLWDWFDLCRHPEQLRRAPAGQRCAYYDMGRCDAPCDATAPPDDYARRTQAAWDFLCGEHDAFTADARNRMRQAAAQQRFEFAGQIKQQLDQAERAIATWARHVQPITRVDHLLLLAAPRRRAWKPFRFFRGELIEGPLLRERELTVRLPAWLTEQAAGDAAGREPAADPELRMELSWLHAHLCERLEAERAIRVPRSGAEPAAWAAQALLAVETWREAPLPGSAEPTDREESSGDSGRVAGSS
jgi:DNA polymerase-3 subunit epsilon